MQISRSRSWFYSTQRNLSVMSGDTKCSHAKQPGRLQVRGQYFTFISFVKKVQASLYAHREPQNKSIQVFLIAHPLRCLKEHNGKLFICDLFGVRNVSAFDVNGNGKVGE